MKKIHLRPPKRRQPTDAHSPADKAPRRRAGVLLSRIALIVLIICGALLFADWWTCLPEGTRATYVGRQSCAKCHAEQVRQWTGSDHDLAMDVATEQTVLGDFGGVELSHYGITSRMYRKDGKFMVHTEGPDGALDDFEVKYVLGVHPLQQYMVEFDRPRDLPAQEIARLQVLRISWDTRRRRWFYLSPPDVDESVERLRPDDDLHWTGIAQRWNNMCAECHSTNLQKRFDVKTNTYHTTFSEIDVSCEACHGPGSIHIRLAQSKSLFWDRKLGYGLARLKSKNPETEVQTCAPCHSRRRVVYPNFRPGENYYDYFANELLYPTTYYADGQILDEVYVYGSFIQSKMYHKAVRCTDCHDPHTARLKHKGNQVCTSCHMHPTSQYDTPTHHHHQSGSTGASCAECHMPESTYMDVDPRRDHSLRVPRPDLSVALGTPNACTRCHLADSRLSAEKRASLKQYADWIRAARGGDEQIRAELARLDQWASQAVRQWYGERQPSERHFAYTLHLARTDRRAAEPELMKLATQMQVPAIVRATALSELSGAQSRSSLAVARRAVSDPSPMVRAAALARIENEIAIRSDWAASVPPEAADRAFQPLVSQLVAMLDDDARLVRTEAARLLAGVPPFLLPRLTSGPERQAMREALQQFEAGVLVNNDRAAAHMTLGILYENLGQPDRAVAAYRTALRVEPGVTGPRTNLAALLDRLSEDAARRGRQAAIQGDRAAQEAAERRVAHLRAEAATLRREELDLLARDAHLAPDNAAIQYRYGLSLYLHDQPDQAEQHLLRAYQLAPDIAQYALALALLYQKQARWQAALRYAEQVVKLRPANLSYRQLLKEIRAQAAGGPAPSR